MKVRTATIHDGSVVKDHPLFDGASCRKHSSCGCFYELERRFTEHLRNRPQEEVDRKRRKFSRLIAAQYAFAGS